MSVRRDRGISSTQTTLEILQVVRRLESAGVTEIANELGVAKSTVHRHLTTLLEDQYLVREGDAYELSFRFLTLGEYVRTRNERFRTAERKVRHLADRTGERCQFIVEEHGYAVYIHVAMGDRAVRTDSALGKRVPMNAVSAGKAILSRLPDEQVRDILDRRGLPARTPNTITDESALLEDLQRTRERGFALNDEESTLGLRAISVPATDLHGNVIGAFGVSGPTHRFRDDRFREELPDLLLGVVNEFELDIQHQ